MDRVKTGISGLDYLIEGGIPMGSSVLISGGSGTGKTILATQYIYEGAKKFGEPGLMVTLEGNIKNISWNMENFNWDIKALQDKNLMKIYRLNLDSLRYAKSVDEQVEYINKELETISEMVKDMGAMRLVVDSTTALGVWIKQDSSMRGILYRFTNALKDFGCTTLMTSETRGSRNDFSAFGVEEFVADSVIALYFISPNRSIFIRKMRGTNHSKKIHPFEITGNGIEIKFKDELMWQSMKE
ncbi:MAG: AAA family ATPase [Candidatus Diapherotrites archaeon]|nr:AAA family ATPase [Candidatus Diapherotrites archaeon]